MGLKLRNGYPSIETVSWEKDNSILRNRIYAKTRQEKVVASRIKEELLAASVLELVCSYFI